MLVTIQGLQKQAHHQQQNERHNHKLQETKTQKINNTPESPFLSPRTEKSLQPYLKRLKVVIPSCYKKMGFVDFACQRLIISIMRIKKKKSWLSQVLVAEEKTSHKFLSSHVLSYLAKINTKHHSKKLQKGQTVCLMNTCIFCSYHCPLLEFPSAAYGGDSSQALTDSYVGGFAGIGGG